MANIQVQHDNPVQKLKKTLNADSVQQQFKNALQKGSDLFVASLIDLYANDKNLQQCDPNRVIMEALKAATLKLPINKTLGFAYIIPFKNNKDETYDPVMVIGYKGYLQLAQRTGQYRYINADCIYAGESVERDRLTGEVIIGGNPTSDKAIAYFAFFETVTGFRKVICWTRKEVDDHAKKYSKSYHNAKGKWKNDFNVMAIKTVIRQLISKYGIMSIDIANAIDIDSGDYKEPEIETPQHHAISYDATAQAPPEKSKVVDFKQSAPPPDQESPPDEKDKEPDQAIGADEFGTPTDSPFEKRKWFHLRAGSPNDGTGFAAYVKTHHEQIAGVSQITYNAMVDKYKKLYIKDFPWRPNGDPVVLDYKTGSADPDIPKGADDQPPPLSDDDLQPAATDPLESDAAKILAGLASKHRREYMMIVRGRNPENVDQIFEWIDAINELVVKHAQEPPQNDSDDGNF